MKSIQGDEHRHQTTTESLDPSLEWNQIQSDIANTNQLLKQIEASVTSDMNSLSADEGDKENQKEH